MPNEQVRKRLCNTTPVYVGAECGRTSIYKCARKYENTVKRPMKTKTKKEMIWGKTFHTQYEIHKRGKYNNTSKLSRFGIKRYDSHNIQRHNGDNKYENATEKRLKWVSSKCTHYYTVLCFMSLCVAFMRHITSSPGSYCYRFVLAFTNCGGYFSSFVAYECLCVANRSMYWFMFWFTYALAVAYLFDYTQHVCYTVKYNMQQNRGDFKCFMSF